MRSIQVYSRQGCHLCEVLIESLLPIVHGKLAVDIRDIDSADAWRSKYDTLVPVVEFEGIEICRYELDRAALRKVLDHIDDAGNDKPSGTTE